MKLKKKVALVVGGATGIGHAIATAFAAEGATIVIAGLASTPINKAIDTLKTQGVKALGINMDQGIEHDCIRTVKETVDTFGKLDILVNCAAAVGQVGPINELETEQWESTFRVNVTGLMVLCREAVKVMAIQNDGAILNISSGAGRQGLANRAPYVCSKWAMQGFTQTLALETAQQGIRVNAICPGPILTDRLRGSLTQMAVARSIKFEDVLAEFAAQSPMGRFATEEECANVAVFLVSETASAMTGQALNVSAGLTMT